MRHALILCMTTLRPLTIQPGLLTERVGINITRRHPRVPETLEVMKFICTFFKAPPFSRRFAIINCYKVRILYQLDNSNKFKFYVCDVAIELRSNCDCHSIGGKGLKSYLVVIHPPRVTLISYVDANMTSVVGLLSGKGECPARGTKPSLRFYWYIRSFNTLPCIFFADGKFLPV